LRPHHKKQDSILLYSFVPNSLSETFFTSSFLGYRSIETKRLKMSMDK